MITYTETRRHSLSKLRMMMIGGSLATHQHSMDAGCSVRVHAGGYWGFAASPVAEPADLEVQARRNAAAMSHFGARTEAPLPGGVYRGEHHFEGRPQLSAKDCSDRLAELHAHCKRLYPDLKTTRFLLQQEQHTKHVTTSHGADAHGGIQRAGFAMWLLAQDERGLPVEVYQPISGRGSLAELDLTLETLAPLIDELHTHLQAKRRAVPARGGLHTVVLAPPLAGMLAHEAMGHPCEADIVLGGAITADLVGRRVASELVTMVDFAHHALGQETMVPVYADDEGTPARDAVLIERGVLKDFMSSRETAQALGLAPSGSARAYGPLDEPLVRMRNTAILPGTSKLDEMIAGVEDGYLLMSTSNGQADSTTEFMFGISLGYEIRDGRLGRAIRDTTLSGNAIQALQTVDAVSDDMHWSCAGYCGKKQPMVVSMGGPALRARAHLGGE
ncbi:MAG: TldD/PmbA family protein [Ideonella sp.]|nr:TldD/PmbA family protein [Ideonella sp.]MBL0147345.1 TldD/PmbA family protein [Ideonella sp.]